MGKKGKGRLDVEPEVQAQIFEKRQLKGARRKLLRAEIKTATDLRNNSLCQIDWASLNLPPIKKDVYENHVKTSNRSPEEVDMYRKEKRITVKGVAPNPITSFQEVRFPDFFMKKIYANYKEPTPTQAQTWPIAMSGHNMVCIANDDKGKELAYLLPAIAHIRAQPPPTPGEGSIVLILGANNDSVDKIAAVIQEYTFESSITFVCVTTGIPKPIQADNVNLGHHIIIGTPTRLADFLIDRRINLKRCTLIVLSDVDRMFYSDLRIRQVIGQTRPDRQILMFACETFKDMSKFVDEVVGDHIEINVEPSDLPLSYIVKQHIIVGMEIDKGPKLKEILLKIYADKHSREKTMIFVATKKRVDKVRKFINSFLENCSAISNKRKREDKILMLHDFNSGKSNILVTMDTASRDFTVKKIRYIINFDYPLDPKNYIRRLNQIDPGVPGHAYTFFTRKDAIFGQDLIKILQKTGQFVNKGIQHMARLGVDPTQQNSIPVYTSGTRSGLTVEKKKLPAASGKIGGASGSMIGDENLDSESDADDLVLSESAASSSFYNRKNYPEFGNYSSGNKKGDGVGFRDRNIEDGGCGGLFAGGGAGFGNDSPGFRESSGVRFGYEDDAKELSESESQVSFGGMSGHIRAGSGSEHGSHNTGFHAGGGAGFGNTVGDMGFSNHGGGSGFGKDDNDILSTGTLAGFGNVIGFGGDDSNSFRSTANGLGVANEKRFGSNDGRHFWGECSRDGQIRFGDKGDRNIGGGIGLHNRDGDAVTNRSNFAAERDPDSRDHHDFNRGNDEHFSSKFADYTGTGYGEKGDGHFNIQNNDNYSRIEGERNFGGRGYDHYSQRNECGFGGSGGDLVRESGISDGFDNRHNDNFRDFRGDGGRRENIAFNNRSDGEFNGRDFRGDSGRRDNVLLNNRSDGHGELNRRESWVSDGFDNRHNVNLSDFRGDSGRSDNLAFNNRSDGHGELNRRESCVSDGFENRHNDNLRDFRGDGGRRDNVLLNNRSDGHGELNRRESWVSDGFDNRHNVNLSDFRGDSGRSDNLAFNNRSDGHGELNRRESWVSDGFENRHNDNLRDFRGDGGRRENVAFNNGSGGVLKRRENLSSRHNTLHVRSDDRRFDNRNGRKVYSDGHKSNHNQLYKPYYAGDRGSGYDR